MKEPAKKPAAAKAAPKEAPKEASKEAPAKEAPKKAAAAKKPAMPKSASAVPNAFGKPLTPSKELSAVVGAEALPRTEAVKKVWEYIKKHKLQNEANKREILADDKLKAVFDKDKVTMFEMNKYLAKHLK